MGFFGSSRKQARDPFQPAVEQHKRRASSARFRERQSGPARHDMPFAWCDSDNAHPYGQPGFGFYSGENLAAGLPRRTEPTRPLSVDESFQGMGPGYPIDSWATGLAFSPHQSYPKPSFKSSYARDIPYFDLGLRMRTGPRDLHYNVPEEFCSYPGCGSCNDFVPSTSSTPLGKLLPFNYGEMFRSRAACAERPIFDHFPPSRKSPTPKRYPIPEFHSHMPTKYSPGRDPYANRTVDPISDARTNSWPPHPPGSYERLRPPHLQRENGRSGSGRITRSSNGPMS